VPIRDTVLHSWILDRWCSVAGAVWAHRRICKCGTRKTWQLAVEYIVDYIEKLIRRYHGPRHCPQLVPYLTTMISYILLANLLSTFPLLSSPTRDLNTTLALSVVSFGSWHYYGIQKRGLGPYLHSFIEPMVFLLPLNILGLVSRVVSMALRLFGNVIAGEMIGAVMFMLVPLLIPLPLSALGMITGVLQALVFTVLTLVFVVDAIGSEEDEAAVAHVPSTT
jgi:F-type H+-transporting ATPase subunit a